jgi:hypothetical protein
MSSPLISKKARMEEITRQIGALERELKDSDQITRDMLERRQTILRELASLRNALQTFIPKELTVSDHAVLRYAERHYKFPIDKIRGEIHARLKTAKNVGEITFMGFVIKGNTVVTYLQN